MLAEVLVGRPSRHAEFLAKAIAEVLSYGGRSPREIDAVAVDVGPGMYTGLRAGIAAAKAFGLAVSRPLIPIPSLWAIGYRVSRVVGPEVVVVADARRKEVFWQVLPPSIEELVPALLQSRGGAQGPADIGLELGRIEDLVAGLESLGSRLARYTVAGEGGRLYRDEILREISVRTGIEPPRFLDDMEYPPASAVAAAARTVANLEPRIAVAPENVRAIYMRAADAKRASAARIVSLVPDEVFI